MEKRVEVRYTMDDKAEKLHVTGDPGLTIIYSGPTVSASDGYHTFEELYEHRVALFMALCKAQLNLFYEGLGDKAWKSKHHSDGTMFEGWFIMGIGKGAGHQITYHLPIEKWDECEFAEEVVRAPEFDGHTPADVLTRLKNL